MLDLDFGTFPYVTSSTTTAGGVATGLGMYVRSHCYMPRLHQLSFNHGLLLLLQCTEQAGVRDGRCEGVHNSRWWRSLPHWYVLFHALLVQ